MFQQFKNILRKFLFAAGIDITKNQKYDRLTLAIMKKVLKQNSNCIDVGCHKGEVLDEILSCSPNGTHFGFEPIPEYFNYLFRKYEGMDNVKIKQVALSNTNGKVSFNWVKNAPAYSGLQERKYDTKNPEIVKIEVDTIPLDHLLDEIKSIQFIKIDVEGAELKVLQGARKLIEKFQPLIIFECGKGAADFYGTTPEMVFKFFKEINYHIYNLSDYIHGNSSLDEPSFSHLFNNNIEYYFVAASGSS